MKIVEMLLDSGADTSIMDRSQDPPLHTAIRTGEENLIQVGFSFMFVTDCIVINTGLIFAVSLGIKRRQLLNILTERRILNSYSSKWR